MNLKEEIRNFASEFYPEILLNRCHLHQNPELSFQEYQTAEFISQKLTEYKIEYQSNIADTGVVGWIKGKNPDKKMIALRADTDALPIDEENDVPYRSVNKGVMHACGHDVHTASLLGTARILNQLRNEFEGTVMLIFQPSEEKLPGGAKRMIDAGIFNNRKPAIILGQHVFPGLEAGYVGFRPGMYMASSDELYVTVRGKGGHGAMPHQVADTILIASHIIVALQQIVSRNAHAAIPTVLSFGKITANGATNIIPREVKIEGTFRTMNENWRAQAHEKMIKLAQSIAEGMGAECDFIVKKGYPFLVNDEAVTNSAVEFAGDFLGTDKISGLELRMTAEDFSYYTLEYPCTYYRLGVKKPGKVSFPLHSSRFDIDESALKTGPALMAYLAVSFLKKS
ncbi:MAG: M20 family metallopeptidase [Bacteroidota bacterium]|nr:M20 family metallopeptidase [Bacteroidota bacterium]